ncbi:MAG: type II toxin-antitoxin system VapC family toxin [Nitrospirae bacterium]|nr:type II toxin-antitoxin system VapC family toxin [Nitrospirota bacterium]
MVIVDSSGWIEYFTDGPLASTYARHLKDVSRLATPTIVLYEVYKKIKRERAEEDALSAASVMNRTTVVPLTESIALLAADLCLKHSLPMADAVVYATAVEKQCSLITSDGHFEDHIGVTFIRK